MAVKKYLRRKRKHSSEGNASQPFFKAETEHHEMSDGESFFSPSVRKVQTKMTLSQPGDPQEQQADHMAEKVTTNTVAPSLEVQRSPTNEEEKVSRAAKKEEEEKISRTADKEEEEKVQKKDEEEEKVQKKDEEEEKVQKKDEEEEKVQKKDEEEEKSDVQRKTATNGQGTTVHPALASSMNNSKGTGSQLSTGTIKEMSGLFGYDFGTVRIHTDSASEKMNDQLRAQAFTHGQDIYFNSGKFNPGVIAGKKLLAHELTHVVQQKQSELPRVQRQKVAGISTPVPAGFKITEKKKKVVYARGKIDGTTITIYRDATGSVGPGLDAQTSLNFSYTFPKKEVAKGRISKLTGNVVIRFSIKTVYKPGVSPSDPSGMGAGSDPKDADKTMEFHEGSHGLSALAFLQKNPLPTFSGKVGMTVGEYNKAKAAFKRAMAKYNATLQSTNKKEVDCIGKKASFCTP
jgi:outer membrane biosynthesis protein TonB